MSEQKTALLLEGTLNQLEISMDTAALMAEDLAHDLFDLPADYFQDHENLIVMAHYFPKYAIRFRILEEALTQAQAAISEAQATVQEACSALKAQPTAAGAA